MTATAGGGGWWVGWLVGRVHDMASNMLDRLRCRLAIVLVTALVMLAARDMAENAMLTAVQYAWCPEPPRTWLRLSAAAVARRASSNLALRQYFWHDGHPWIYFIHKQVHATAVVLLHPQRL